MLYFIIQSFVDIYISMTHTLLNEILTNLYISYNRFFFFNITNNTFEIFSYSHTLCDILSQLIYLQKFATFLNMSILNKLIVDSILDFNYWNRLNIRFQVSKSNRKLDDFLKIRSNRIESSRNRFWRQYCQKLLI